VDTDRAHELIAKFLGDRCETTGDTWLAAPELQAALALAHDRAASLHTKFLTACCQESGRLWSELSGQVFKMHRTDHRSVSVVVALYDERDILWLDCLSRGPDFETFVRRERLTGWLPHRLEDFVELLTKTKLHILLMPRMVRSISEIPPLTARHRSTLASQEPEFLAGMDERLAGLAGQIQPPECVSDPDGTFRLVFYLWTEILGKVIRSECSLGPGCSFTCRATQLTEEVGMFIPPRFA
jgi:hypothetical protein